MNLCIITHGTVETHFVQNMMEEFRAITTQSGPVQCIMGRQAAVRG